ncbi:phenylalanine--tRNA ligase subunit alpha [Candidatus Pacearchaeota archaeon]|nr:phenylalanine--tRNA ligase subunit alpha [Candidatus Pacearchaeota archaeon]
MPEKENIQKIIESLSPIERSIIPHLNSPIPEIIEKSGLDSTSVLRALQFLSNKGLIIFSKTTKSVIDLGTNGVYYKKNHLPERRLILLLEEKNHLPIQEAKKLSKLSDNEFKVSLGVLKSKALISLDNGKISLQAKKEELTKNTIEEALLELLPIEESKIKDEQLLALQNLQKRKDIIEINKKTIVSFSTTDLGKQIASTPLQTDLIESVTPKLIKSWNSQKSKRFRSYDLSSTGPKIYGGKKHFVNQGIEYGKRIWLDLGFKEMQGSLVQTSFWNFDALFTAQDHPVRDLQDTFYIKDIKGQLPKDKNLVKAVKQAHESGVKDSKGWQYSWDPEEASSVVLRTHTTCLSAQTLSSLDIKKDLPAKFFSIGKVLRNETVDWSHGFEFLQTEGIVVSESVSFRDLLGYLQEFYKKMGFEKIRFAPAYFPYTEPSVEVSVYHPEKKVWLELGGAGIFRPELTIPLLGKAIPVLAWGQGFDRILMDYYKIKDFREFYQNNLKSLREKRAFIK